MTGMNPWKSRIDNLPKKAVQSVSLDYPHLLSGKVREVFDLGEHLLIVATDRISAFDVIMSEGIPGKGIVLTQLSRYWFGQMEEWDLIPHHLVPDQDAALEETLRDRPDLIPRSMLVQKLEPIPMEAVVRGYLAGSGWKCYRETGMLFDRKVPSGLEEGDRLPAAEFTPSSKAQSGHDEPLTHEEGKALVGDSTFSHLRDCSLALYERAGQKTRSAGILLADTKFEFGRNSQGALVLMDEVFTPDSSRYWPEESYAPGKSQTSFDKQYLRDYLETCDWDKTPPPPPLSPSLVQGILDRYREAYLQITGT